MPGFASSTGPEGYSAGVCFVIPREELHNANDFLTFDGARPLPTIEKTIPIHDLRTEMTAGLRPTLDQLDQAGYAVIEHESQCDLGDALDTVEGTNAYLAETIDLFKKELGASHVISWNSVIRKNTPEAGKDVAEARQLKPEQGKPPAQTIKATARQAHVDQDEDYARVICKRAVGDDVFERYSRVQIVNLWRPLAGPVTNAPLAVGHYRTFAPEDLLVFAGAYGTGLASQRWSYISRQKPSEALLLRCYDSWQGQGPDGVDRALFCPHVAVDIHGEPPLDAPEEPRSSIEVRLIVLHE